MSKKSTRSGKKKDNRPYSEKKLDVEKKAVEQADKEKKEKITRIVIPIVSLVIIAALVALVVFLSTREQPQKDESSTESIVSTVSEEESSSESSEDSTAEESTEPVVPVEGLKATHEAAIEIENYGTIKLDLYEEAAPITVKNFVELAQSGFYNGLTFHRIMKGFMMQGGDPTGSSKGGSGQTIKGEFSQNGWDNPISHLRGTISMARPAGNMDGASSQFFIVHKDNTQSLDGLYASFGRVTEGIEIVDKICNEAQPTDNNGTIEKSQQPVIKSITVTEKA